MTETISLKERYVQVKERVAQAAKRSGRRPEDILLVAVTKHAEPDQIRALMHMGHKDFGENRVQHLIQRAAMVEEYLSRHRVLPHTPRPQHPDAEFFPVGLGDSASVNGRDGLPEMIRWHMIGHLQRNKARKAVEFCRLIQTVDSLRLAEELQTIALRRDEPIDVLVQVNCTMEESKFGCPVPAAHHLAEQIDTMIFVRVRGMMTMARASENPEDSRLTFARCYELFEEISKTGISEGKFNILSMGMSNDFEIAIEEGANIVRVGSAIFGESKEELDEEPASAEHAE